MSRIVFVARHAEPEREGGMKMGLSQAGGNQAAALALLLQNRIGREARASILCSPLKRCVETAAVIAEKLATSHKEAPLRFLGAEKLAISDIQSKYTTYMHSYQCLGIESPDEYVRRFVQLIQHEPASVVIAIGNEVTLRVLLQILGGNTYNTRIRHAECFELTFSKDLQGVTIERVQ
jgi:broad specificity phosphatase PhoE